MKFNWKEVETSNPVVYYVEPGQYTAVCAGAEVHQWSDHEKPIIGLKWYVKEQNASIEDQLRLYGGAFKIAASKIDSLGVDISALPETDIEACAAIISAVCKGMTADFVCEDFNTNSGKTVTSVRYYLNPRPAAQETAAPAEPEPAVEPF